MTETKEFDPAVLASITTGVLLVAPFSKLHEAAEYILGHPIWTHEFPALSDRLTEAVLIQFPSMPTTPPVAGHWQQYAESLRAEYGDTVAVRKGSAQRTQHPMETASEALEAAGNTDAELATIVVEDRPERR